MARGRLAGADLSLPILGGRGIHFTFIVFADLRQTRGSWFGRRQRDTLPGLGHVDLAWKRLRFSCRIREPRSAVGRHIETRLTACLCPSLCRSTRINGTVGQICRSNGGSDGSVSWEAWWGDLFIEGSRAHAWRWLPASAWRCSRASRSPPTPQPAYGFILPVDGSWAE